MPEIIQILRGIFIAIGGVSLLYTIFSWYGLASVNTDNAPHRSNTAPILMLLTSIILLHIGALSELTIHFTEEYQPWRSLVFVPAFLLNMMGLRWLYNICRQTRADDSN